MRQYLDAKQRHREAILLFRMGDFYEMFFEDALVAYRKATDLDPSRARVWRTAGWIGAPPVPTARESVRRLTPASERCWQGATRRPGLFSRKTDS